MTTVQALLGGSWVVGEPEVMGSLAVFPLIGGGPAVEMVTFSRALEAGAYAKELPEGPSVNDIVVGNPSGSAVLLLDGEEVLGAQQNRVFDGSTLVPARSEVRVPVCCVERGRWDERGRESRFASSSQVADPGLRSTMARARSRAGRSDQREVWREVESRIERTATVTLTHSLAEVYESRRDRLDELVGQARPRPGQRGAMVFVGGRFASLDWVADEAAWADLFPRLVRGYALEGDEAESAPTGLPSREEVEALLAELLAVPLAPAPTPGAGRRLHGGGRARDLAVQASAVRFEDRLAQLSLLAA